MIWLLLVAFLAGIVTGGGMTYIVMIFKFLNE